MKLRVRRSLIGLSAAGSLGLGLVVSRRWSRSEALAHGEHDEQQPQWHLEDYLHAAGENTAHAGQSLAHCLRSARTAWERRQLADTGADGAGGRIASRPSSAVLLADFLTELHEGRQDAQHPFKVPSFDRMSEWLLERATAPLADPAEQRAIQRYLAAVLCSQQAAEALLQRPGVGPKLLRLAAASPQLRQLLGAALERSAAPRDVPTEDVSDAMRTLGAAVSTLRSTSRADAAAGAGGAPPAVRRAQQQAALAMQLMKAWAGASAANASRLADEGVGAQLADLAALTATGTGVDGMQTLIAELMGTLARNAAKPHQLRMQRWLYHLLCLAADAAANGEWQLAGASLTSFATCLLRGCELPVQLMERSTLPLLHQLATTPGSPARPAIALVVKALAEGPGVQLPEEEREFWTEELLQWLVRLPGSAAEGADGADGDGSGSGRQEQPAPALGSRGQQQAREEAALMRRVTAALESLAAPAGSDGLHVAHAWLAELIVHLSRQVQPYNAVPMPVDAPASSAPGAAAAAGGGGRSWLWPFGSGSSSQEAQQAMDAAAAAGAAGQAEAAGAGADADGPYLPPLEQPPGGSADSNGTASSWWKPRWWPWGAAAGEDAEQQAAAKAAAASRPSDSELALYINAAEVGPVYARAVAADLLQASGRVGAYQEPPPGTEDLMGPVAVAVYPQVAAAIDMDLADAAVCQALKVLCALASGGSQRRSWLVDAGILALLRRLTMERARDVAELPSSAGELVEGPIPLCIQRQAVRLLAMLGTDKAGAGEVQAAGWIPWLQDLALSQDLKLSSCASRALLHIESAVAMERPGLAKLALRHGPLRATPAPLLPTEKDGEAAAAAAAAAAAGDADIPGVLPERRPGSPLGLGVGPGSSSSSGEGGESPAAGVVAEAAEMIGEARHALAQARRRLDRKLDAVRPPLPPGERLVMQDGVHLFDPLAPHHEVLAREGISTDSADAPLVDIVFVHGIRGGAFATWRREGVLERGQARESLDRSVCWPSCWVAKELPEARLISLEYAAPASAWEGEALPFQGTVAILMEKLAAAGVGQRPVIFVSHSMGGLVVKDILVTAKQQKDERLRRLNTAAAGAVFYSVPHAGSRLADWGWYLRYLGGSPAKHVRHLKTGPHLEELNAAIRGMCKAGQLPVLSFSEGLPTKLAYIPTHVVPHESAYPGYGEFVVLAQHDHISVCKPTDTADPAYTHLMAFLRRRVQELKRQRADAAAASMDHMAASL